MWQLIADRMIRSLPLYERKSKVFIELFNAEAKEFKLMDEQLDDLKKQFFIDTATWGLAIYEKELKIIAPTGSTFENRRAAIKAKWRSDGKVDRALLEAVASAILKTKVKVEFDGRIVFWFNPDNPIDRLGDFHRTIDDVKPAHLPMKIELRLSSNILLKGKGYDFDVPFPITNLFRTAEVPGGIGRIPFKLKERTYSFEVHYPITNVLVPTGNDLNINDEVGLGVHTAVYYTKYQQSGEIIAGEASL